MKKIQKNAVQLTGLFHHVVWTITPRPVWIVGTRNKNGTPNLSTITCVSNTPGPPENIIVSMAAKRTIANIRQTGEFSVSLVNADMAALADYVGSVSGEDTVKNAVKYDYVWGGNADVPILDASHCVFECKLSHTHEVGMFQTFFGEVVNLHIDAKLTPPEASQEALFKWFQSIDIHKIDPLVYHSLQKYYRVGKKIK